MKHYVWYACYGSNINQDRFILYIKGGRHNFFGVEVSNQGCSDQTPPLKDIPYTLNHPIYFAKEKNRWQGGVAFLDTKNEGFSYGRAYLITYEQFLEIKQQEGAWYDVEVDLGILDGYKVKTFTGFHLDQALPSLIYINTIKDGLLQIGYKESEIETYLKETLQKQENTDII
jgi:hypothetical protein